MVGKKFVKQFKKGQIPNETPNWESTLNYREPADPDKMRKRQGVSLGNQVEARPGRDGGFVGSSGKKRKR